MYLKEPITIKVKDFSETEHLLELPKGIIKNIYYDIISGDEVITVNYLDETYHRLNSGSGSCWQDFYDDSRVYETPEDIKHFLEEHM